MAVRLAHITTVPVSLGFFRGQVGFLKARGIEVHAISSPGPELDAFGASEDLPVHEAPMPRRIAPLSDLRAIARLWAVLRRVRPHIVHAHTPKGGLLGMIAAWLARVPVRVYHIHGLPSMTARGLKRRLLTLSERVACRLAHRVLCVSESVRTVVIDQGLVSSRKIHVLGRGSINGVDAVGRFNPARVNDGVRERVRGELRIPRDALVFGFVGRIVADKGMRELAAAWRELRADVPRLRLLLVGPFEPQDPLAPEDETLFRSDARVHLAGSRQDIPAYLAAMDLFVMPTHREGFGVANIEAAAMGLPVVSTAIPGCVDSVADGTTGTLVPVRDAQALTEAIRRYIDDPELRQIHGRAGRERVLRDFRPEDIWAELLREYTRLLDGRRVPIAPPPEPSARAAALGTP